MKLINDDYNDCWVWVDDLFEDNELSPRFDEESDARQWLAHISKEINNVKNTRTS